MNLFSQLRLLWQVKRVVEDTEEKITMDANGKALITSKTTWANILLGIIQIAGLVSGYIPEQYAPIGVAVQSIANILLRLITNQPITGIVTGGKAAAPIIVLALLAASAAHATSFPNTPLVCVSAGIDASAGFLYDDGDGSACGPWGQGVLCRAEGGPAGSGFSHLPPGDGNPFSFDYLPEPVDGQSILQLSCPGLPGFRACCRVQTVFMSSPTNPLIPTVTAGAHCGYVAR